MPDNELNTPESVPRVVDVATGEGQPNVGGNDTSVVVGLAEVVNRALGTTFQDDASAYKGLENTAKDRGKLGKYRPLIEQLEATKGGEFQALKVMEQLINQPNNNPVAPQPAAPQPQPQAPSVDTSNFVSRDQYERDLWYGTHKELVEYAPILDALKTSNQGKSYDEVAQLPAFKTFYEKATAAENLQNQRQPLVSSNRVYSNAPSEERMKDFEEAKKTKDWSGFLRKYKGFDLMSE